MRQRKLPAKLLMVTALTFVSFIMVGQCFGVFGKAMPDDREGKRHDLLLHEIASYRQWTLVNPTPVLMDPASAQACAVFINQKFNPHSRKYVSVYVNRKGYSAMMTQLHPHFPEGSIIVKEKLSDKLSQTPELLTVMIKREEGYNPKSRNWEYLVSTAPLPGFLSKQNRQPATAVIIRMQKLTLLQGIIFHVQLVGV